jgi:protein-histidine N-methyltransferase
MAFSFGFSGDDIEEDPNDVQDQGQQPATTDSDVPPPIPAKTHDLDELVSMRFWCLCNASACA